MRNACALCLLCMLAALAGCKQPTTSNTANLHDYTTTSSLLQSYTETYDTRGSLLVRSFNADGSVAEYSVFQYDGSGNNIDVKIYSSDTVVDASTLIGESSYVYDANGNCTSGTISKEVGVVMTRQETFAATYNLQHNYLDCLLLDGSGGVMEHRVCTYDSSGENYIDEKYYSD
jgi:hypothetical protein